MPLGTAPFPLTIAALPILPSDQSCFIMVGDNSPIFVFIQKWTHFKAAVVEFFKNIDFWQSNLKAVEGRIKAF